MRVAWFTNLCDEKFKFQSREQLKISVTGVMAIMSLKFLTKYVFSAKKYLNCSVVTASATSNDLCEAKLFYKLCDAAVRDRVVIMLTIIFDIYGICQSFK